MSKLPEYPLEQMISIKKNRFDAAVKILEEKKNLLEKAYELLYDLTEAKDKVLDHKNAKLTQLRDMLDAGTGAHKVLQAKAYLKVVDVKLQEHEKKVADQQKAVDAAQKAVDAATDDLFQKKKDLEKLELHKKEWEKEIKYQLLQKEMVEQDEQGSSTHTMHKREKNLRKKQHENQEKRYPEE